MCAHPPAGVRFPWGCVAAWPRFIAAKRVTRHPTQAPIALHQTMDHRVPCRRRRSIDLKRGRPLRFPINSALK